MPRVNLRARRFAVRSLFSAIAVVIHLTAGLSAARAQESAAFVYVTDVQVTQLSNAVRLTIQADGTIDLDQNNDLIYQFVTATPEFHITPVRQMHLRLLNCRSRLGSFKDVGLFPVDHVEFAVPQDSSSGVGLDVTFSFDEPILPGKIMDEFSGGPTSLPAVSVIQSPDRRGIIVTVTSDLFPEHQVVRKSPNRPGPQFLAVSALDRGLLEVTAVNEPLSAVVRRIAEVSGLSVSVDTRSERLISAVLRQPPAEEIATLADAYGLALSARNGAFSLNLPELGTGSGADLSVFPLRRLDAQRAVSLLPTFLLHYTHPDVTRNAVIASGSPALRAKVAEDLARLDTLTPQCRVTVTFVTYTRTLDYQRTLEIARRTSNSSVALAAGSGGAPTGTVVYNRGASQAGIDVALSALNQDADLHIDAKPSLLLANGQRGSIFDGQTYFIPDPTAYDGALLQLQVGTTVDVTPLMGGGGVITLQVNTTSSDAASRDPATGLPVIETRRVQDTVRIRSGDTLYIGGLSETQRSVSRFRIPLLGDLPLVGSLFRGRRSHEQRVQIAVFISGVQTS